MADDTKPKPTAAEVTQKPAELAAPTTKPTEDPATPKDADNGPKITVVTTGEFQLFDVTTNTMFPMGEEVEVYENNMFVITQLERGQLKKV